MSTEYQGEERRDSDRTQGAFVVRMRFPRHEDFRYRYTRDISRGGVFIQTLKPKPAGSKVVLVLEPRGGASVTINGEVVTSLGPEEAAARQLQPGMGIRFLDLDAAKRRAIEATIENWDSERRSSPEIVVSSAAEATPPAAIDTASSGIQTQFGVPSAPDTVVRPQAPAGPPRGGPADLAQISADARALLARLETDNYYQLLGVEPAAASGEIRRAFLKLTRRFHPDNYFRRAPEALSQDLEDIYNQLTHSYETLIDRDRRISYDVATGNLGGNRDGLSAEEMARVAGEERRRKASPGRVTKSEQLIALANQDLAAGQTSKALANLRLALAFDPENTLIQTKINELRGKRS